MTNFILISHIVVVFPLSLNLGLWDGFKYGIRIIYIYVDNEISTFQFVGI